MARRRARKRKVANLIRRALLPNFESARSPFDPITARDLLVKPDIDAEGLGFEAFAAAFYRIRSRRGQCPPPRPKDHPAHEARKIHTGPDHPPRSRHRGEEMAAIRTRGHFVAINRKDKRTGKDVPNPHVEDAKPKRSHSIAEFDAIFATGERWKPEVFTPELRKAFLEAIFYHRPVKPGDRGTCAYMPAELRTWKDTDAFQRFCIRKELADLRYVTPDRPAAMLPPEVIEDIKDDLFGGKRRTWAQIEKRLRKSVGSEASLNFEGFANERRKGLSPRTIIEDGEDAVSSGTGNALVIAFPASQGLKCTQRSLK